MLLSKSHFVCTFHQNWVSDDQSEADHEEYDPLTAVANKGDD